MPDTPSDIDYDKEPEDPSPDFTKGFNEGYLLATHAPEVGGLFGAYAPETERGKGFRHGKEQLALDRPEKPYPNYLKDTSDNKTDMGVQDSQQKKVDDFRESVDELGLTNTSYPAWLVDREENKADINLDRGRERESGDIEPNR